MRLLLSLLLAASFALLPPPTAAATGGGEPDPVRDGAWPLWPRPQLVRGFDPPRTAFGSGHRGVDLLGRTGQAVHTSLAGHVTFAARLAGRGVVVVDHGGIRTTYEPVTARVAVGDVVARGAVIGSLQHPASHCLPSSCLHWGLLRGSTYLNPLVLVGAGRVRLLPLDPARGSGSTSPDGPPAMLPWPTSPMPMPARLPARVV